VSAAGGSCVDGYVTGLLLDALAPAALEVSLAEMMDRMGHSSPRAALIYMHGNDARQRKIADSLNKLPRSELSRNGQRAKDSPRRKPSGTQRARKSPGAS
jgi:hypothetical protein